jgi:ferredoxin-type protein NapH
MKEAKRNGIQALAALLTNSHLTGFVTGKIWQGSSKRLCVPGLNCYSCPGAVGSCPIGALQNALGGRSRSFPYYVAGALLLFGTVLGRLVCGFLCPFGFVQDLLHKLPTRKCTVPRRADRPLRWLKYLLLIGLVILAPLLLVDAYGIGAPAFCKFVCPAGTLEGGVPLLLRNLSLRSAVGWLWRWKLLVAASVLVLSVIVYRPFCRYLCPLGALYGLCNRFSLYQIQVDDKKCTRCGACRRACKMGVDITRTPASPECIRCGACREACPAGAVTEGFHLRRTAVPDPLSPPDGGR